MAAYPKLSRYEVLGRLATGGMAEVWVARAVGPGGFEKTVVLKTILKNLADDPRFTQMFINEARLAAMLSHQNCVQIFDLGQDAGTLYIAMEYIDGFSLSRIFKRSKSAKKPLPLDVLCRIMMDAASGLDYAHRLTDRAGKPLGLVHRDVSPDNLLVSFSGQTRLVDFGVAKAASQSALAATTGGIIKGKAGYIAPEYLKGGVPDGRADLFALGVVFYRALTGKRPFTGPSEAAVSMAVLTHTPPPADQLVPSVPPAISSVVQLALEKDPAVRFESARAMRQAIASAVGTPADVEAVGDYLTSLWPPGDPERAALEALVEGKSEESSGAALESVVSSGFGFASPSSATGPKRFPSYQPLEPRLPDEPAPEAAPPASPSAPELPELPEPPPAAPAEPSPPPAAAHQVRLEQTLDESDDEEPTGRRWWLLTLAAAVVAATGYLLTRPDRPSSAGEQVTPPAAIAPAPEGGTPPAPSTGSAARLAVTITPPVTVFELKKELGRSPLDVELPAGTHTLRLLNRAAGIDHTLTVELEAGRTTTVGELGRGTLVIKAKPWAYVKIDGRSFGETPVSRQVYEGAHLIELSNPGLNLSRRLEVKVKAGETRPVAVNFEGE